LKIAGFQKNSFIDYPGNISCILFTAGCNFRCPYCHNPDAVKGIGEQLSEDDFFSFLKKRHGLLDAVVISGGEPTLQQGLMSFCKKLRLLNYKIKLDTNGSDSKTIRKLISENLVDYIAMDIKTDPGSYGDFFSDAYDHQEITKSIDIILNSDIDYEFRTTCVSPFTDHNIMHKIGRVIQGARLYILQQFREERVLNRDFFNRQNRKIHDNDILSITTTR